MKNSKSKFLLIKSKANIGGSKIQAVWIKSKNLAAQQRVMSHYTYNTILIMVYSYRDRCELCYNYLNEETDIKGCGSEHTTFAPSNPLPSCKLSSRAVNSLVRRFTQDFRSKGDLA